MVFNMSKQAEMARKGQATSGDAWNAAGRADAAAQNSTPSRVEPDPQLTKSLDDCQEKCLTGCCGYDNNNPETGPTCVIL